MVPPDRPSRHGLSSSVIIGNREVGRLALHLYLSTTYGDTSRETSPYNMPRERREGRRRRRTREGKGVQKVSAQRATARRKAPGLGDISLVCFPCSSPSSPWVPPVRRRHSPQPNQQQQQQHKSTQHNTHPGRERKTKKAGVLRLYLLVRTAQHSTARCCSQRTPALLVTRKVRPARWRGREGTGEALSSVFRRKKPCEENICIHRINSAVL